MSKNSMKSEHWSALCTCELESNFEPILDVKFLY